MLENLFYLVVSLCWTFNISNFLLQAPTVYLTLRHFSLIPQIRFISHQNENSVGIVLHLCFTQPKWTNITKSRLIADIENEKNRMSISIIGAWECPKFFLAGCVPDMESNIFVIDEKLFEPKINSNGRQIVFMKLIFCKADENGRLAYSWISNQDHLVSAVNFFNHFLKLKIKCFFIILYPLILKREIWGISFPAWPNCFWNSLLFRQRWPRIFVLSIAPINVRCPVVASPIIFCHTLLNVATLLTNDIFNRDGFSTVPHLRIVLSSWVLHVVALPVWLPIRLPFRWLPIMLESRRCDISVRWGNIGSLLVLLCRLSWLHFLVIWIFAILIGWLSWLIIPYFWGSHSECSCRLFWLIFHRPKRIYILVLNNYCLVLVRLSSVFPHQIDTYLNCHHRNFVFDRAPDLHKSLLDSGLGIAPTGYWGSNFACNLSFFQTCRWANYHQG